MSRARRWEPLHCTRMDVSLGGLGLSWLLLVLLHAAHGVEECLRRGGAGYHGSHRVSADGRPCLNWLEVQKSAVAPLPMVAEDHSFCRNPDGAPLPWCYVTSKHGVPEMHLCDIPSCQAPEVPSPSFSSGELQDVEGDKESAPEPADLMLTSQALDSPTPTAVPEESQGGEVEKTQLFDLTDLLPSRSESAAVQPVIGIRQRVRVNPKEKKDLGTLGYVLGVVMMVIIIAIGSGIVVGYLYKRGRDLKKQHEQTVYEREMQRITLPLSAFSNPTCEIVDENTIVVHASQTPVEESQQEGDVPLMAQAGTPGA